VNEANGVEVNNEAQNQVDNNNEEGDEAENEGSADIDDSSDGNIDLGAGDEKDGEVDGGTGADAQLDAGADRDDEREAEIDEDGDGDGEDQAQAEAGNSLDLGEAQVEGGLDLEDNGDEDVDVDLDGAVNGDIDDVGLDAVNGGCAGAESIVDGGNITSDNSLALHRDDLLHHGGDTASGKCNSIAAGNKASLRGGGGEGESREGSNAEDEEGLERRHCRL
jgi:hypothetical protein